MSHKQEILDNLNKIRHRAGIAEYGTGTDENGFTRIKINFSDQKEVRRLIHKERRVEFVGEGVRFFDMKRCAIPAKRYSVYGKQVSTTIKPDDYRWTLPIPASEYRYNTLVKQNEGWPVLAV